MSTTTANPGSLKRAAADPDVDGADGDYAPSPPAKKSRASGGGAKKARASAGGVPDKCGLSKKELGDKIQAGLRIEKYDAQRTMVSTTMDATFFRAFFGVPGVTVKLSPPEFDDTTPVVVADFSGSVGGQIFGVSKVKGGNRYTTNHVERVLAVIYPAQEQFTMFFSI